jgi:hypothetical protein
VKKKLKPEDWLRVIQIALALRPVAQHAYRWVTKDRREAYLRGVDVLGARYVP